MEASRALELPDLRPGIYRGLSMADYLALPAMSASRLELIRRSPLQYKHSLSEPPRTSTALERGTALHLALLEPALFEGRYVTIGQCNGRKKDGDRCSYQGSVWRDGESYCKTHDQAKGEDPDPSVEILAEGEYEKVMGMRAAVLAHPRAKTLFDGAGDFEATVVFADPETGTICKIRPDRLVERAGMHAALKSARNASDRAFPKDAENRGYFRSLAFYRRGLRAIGWPYRYTAVLAVEPEPPHDLECFLVDEAQPNAFRADAALESADEENSQLLRIYSDCLKEDHWPGYNTGEFHLLSRPRWATRNTEEG